MKSEAIGIFDSGMGGLSVLALAIKKMPNEKFIYYGDSKNAPYGVKSKEEVTELSIKICDYFISKNVKAIVVACNTATSVAIKILRKKYDIPIIGMEPALKPAIENNNKGNIAVMATTMTLREDKFKNLLENLETSREIYKIPAPKIVELVEKGIVTGVKMENVLKECFENIPLTKIESIVLGCTHFVFIKASIYKFFDRNINLYDGNEGTIMQLRNILNKNKLLNDELNNDENKIELINSLNDKYINISYKLIENF